MTKPDGVASESCIESNPSLDVESLADTFRTKRRLRIPEFLRTADALALHQTLAEEVRWRSFLMSKGKMLAGPVEGKQMTPETRDRMRAIAYEDTRGGPACWFDANRVFPEDLRARADTRMAADARSLESFAQLMGSPRMLAMFRTLTGVPEIVHAEIRTTRFRAGQFANFTNTFASSEEFGTPCAVFFLNLSVEWLVEWGGLLEFHAGEAYSAEGFVPSFNVLDLFSLRQGYWISQVATFATGERLGIEGRLYAKRGNRDVQH